MGYSAPLHELRRTDESRFGGKSANLGELLAADIPVPPGFAISIEALRAFVREAGLADEIAERISGVVDTDDIGSAADAIGEAMRSAPMPEAIADEVAARYHSLSDEEAPAVAVRSSAVGEDSQATTFAGQQETYLWVRDAKPVCAAVRDCWISLYSVPALSYRLSFGQELTDAAMAVTVQLMVDAAVAGVMFTCNPVSGDRSMVAINGSWGLGLAVVGGDVTPDDYLVSKVTGEVVREQVHAKSIEYVPDPRGRGTIRREIPPERADNPCLDRAALSELLQLARQVERHFGAPQDVEWAIDRNGSVFVLQTRPVTAVGAKPRTDVPKLDALSLVMKTFGASPRP